LQGCELFDGVVDFQYTLVDVKLLDREYLLENHDAICASIAVDKVRGDGFELLYETLMSIANARQGFEPEDFADFLTWFKHTLEHRVGSEEEADKIIEVIKERDGEKMRTGIDILFDNVEARGVVEAAYRLLIKGKTIQEAADLLDLTDDQVRALEVRAGLVKDVA